MKILLLLALLTYQSFSLVIENQLKTINLSSNTLVDSNRDMDHTTEQSKQAAQRFPSVDEMLLKLKSMKKVKFGNENFNTDKVRQSAYSVKELTYHMELTTILEIEDYLLSKGISITKAP